VIAYLIVSIRWTESARASLFMFFLVSKVRKNDAFCTTMFKTVPKILF
jgi:hypothetical protein